MDRPIEEGFPLPGVLQQRVRYGRVDAPVVSGDAPTRDDQSPELARVKTAVAARYGRHLWHHPGDASYRGVALNSSGFKLLFFNGLRCWGASG
jgi:hypothetical protein